MAVFRFLCKSLRMTFEVVREYLEHVSGSGRRSTVLSTLIVMDGLFLLGLVASLFAPAPEWVLQWLLGLVVFVTALFGIAYTYFMFTNPDALRSERYGLEKMAIEHGIRGDSLQGSFLQIDGPQSPAVSSDPSKQIEAPE